MGVTEVSGEMEVDPGIVRAQQRVSTNSLKGSGGGNPGGMVWFFVRMIQTQER